jgi:hypothetical protein
MHRCPCQGIERGEGLERKKEYGKKEKGWSRKRKKTVTIGEEENVMENKVGGG